jgi:hypothetical protein
MSLRLAARGFDLGSGFPRRFETKVGRQDRMSLLREAKTEAAA